MPDMSGREVFKTIQNQYPGYVEKVIFVTGDTVSQSTHRYLVNTGRPFLSKPFSYQELMETIENTYQQKENKKGGIK
jgi:two-component system NtrC family sensor kinase